MILKLKQDLGRIELAHWLDIGSWVAALIVLIAFLYFSWELGYEAGTKHTMAILHWCGSCP